MRINPGVGRIEPNFEMTFIPPGRCGRLDRLLGRMAGQIFARRRELKILLVERDFADEELEKARSFKPPMSEQFRVERNDDDRIDIERRDLAQLPATLLEKMIRVRISRLFRLFTIVKILFH